MKKPSVLETLAILAESRITNPTHGLVAMADAASFSNIHFSEPLSTYAQGWRDPSDLQGMLDYLYAPVQVPRKFEFRKFDESADFLIDDDDERTVGTDFKRVKYSGSIQNSRTANRGLTMWVDMDEVEGMPNWQQVYTGRLLRRSLRNDLYRGVNLFVAGANLTNKTWDASADPDTDGIGLVSASGDLLGFNPNRIAWFGSGWSKRLTSLRAKDTAGGFSSIALTTPDQVAQYWGAQSGKLIDARVKLPSAAAKSKITTASYVVAYYNEDGVGPEDPSCCKRFWSPCSDGSQYRVYLRQISEKLWAITVERYVNLVVTSTVGMKGFTIA